MTQMTTCDLHNETIIRLQKRIAELESELNLQRSVREDWERTANVAAKQRDYMNEKFQNECGKHDETTMRAMMAESALRECMAHADAMEAEIFNLSAYDSNDAVIAYRQWRAKQ